MDLLLAIAAAFPLGACGAEVRQAQHGHDAPLGNSTVYVLPESGQPARAA